MQRKVKEIPRRLPLISQRYDPPLYFITFNTHARRRLLARPEIHAAFIAFCERGAAHRVGVGRYVLLPDHVHLFVGIGGETTLEWVKQLKQHLGKKLRLLGEEPTRLPGQALTSFWQPGFFDHLLRHNESYAQKWQYVWENPVRAGLVSRAEEWPYSGEII